MGDNKKRLVTLGHLSPKHPNRSVDLFSRFLSAFKTDSYQVIDPFVTTHSRKEEFLEIGPMYGEYCLKKRKIFTHILGIDLITKYAKGAEAERKRVKATNVKFIEADVEKYPLETARFDVVVCLNALSYIEDPYLLLKKVNKSLQPGGLLLISVPNFAFLTKRVRLLFGGLPVCSLTHSMESWDSSMIHYYTEKEFRKLLVATGFEVEKITTSGFFSSIRSAWPSLLGWDLIAVCRKRGRR